MSHAHIFLFSDASGGDWLAEGHGDRWHTIANFLFQSDPELQSFIEESQSHEDILMRDRLYIQFLEALKAQLPAGILQKWSSGPDYKNAFCNAFATIAPKFEIIISACSFQEKILRASKNGLLKSYNQLIGGVEGRGIGFANTTSRKKNPPIKHSYVNHHGFHEIESTEDELLPLLLMTWFIADQYIFHYKNIVLSGKSDFKDLAITVVSDNLSSDGSSEQRLRDLIDPEGNGIPIVIKKSTNSDTFSGDLLVDNVAGWLNHSLIYPDKEYAKVAKDLAPTGILDGWHELLSNDSQISSQPAVRRLKNATEP